MRAAIVIGSPKRKDSASDALAAELTARLSSADVQVERVHAASALHSAEETEAALGVLESADLVVMAFPLYVDTLPAPLIRLLELAAERGMDEGKRLAVVTQCGFPEAAQCETAIRVCERFAAQTGMRFAGAVAMGMGGMVGEGLDKLPGGGKSVRAGLAMAAAALAAGDDVSAEAAELFAKPLMPGRLYVLAGNLGWRMQMRQNKARRPIAYRHYA